MMFYAISYDIRDDSRRNSVSKILERYGMRVQRSLFECNLTSEQVQELLQELEPFIDTEQDSLRCYSLCTACSKNVKRLGGIPISRDPAYYIA
jgi:CRISPR-associated protein Cas2